jgi:hypothetical protein
VSSECLPPGFDGTDISTQSDAQCVVRILEKVDNLLKLAPVCARRVLPRDDCKTMLKQLNSIAPVYDRILQTNGRPNSDLADRLEALDIEAYFDAEGEDAPITFQEIR